MTMLSTPEIKNHYKKIQTLFSEFKEKVTKHLEVINSNSVVKNILDKKDVDQTNLKNPLHVHQMTFLLYDGAFDVFDWGKVVDRNQTPDIGNNNDKDYHELPCINDIEPLRRIINKFSFTKVAFCNDLVATTTSVKFSDLVIPTGDFNEYDSLDKELMLDKVINEHSSFCTYLYALCSGIIDKLTKFPNQCLMLSNECIAALEYLVFMYNVASVRVRDSLELYDKFFNALINNLDKEHK